MTGMHDALKEAFDQVRAEEALKARTRAYLWQKTQGYTRGVPASRRRWIPAAACLLLVALLWGGRWLYFTPTVEISMDINPSIELGVNRFDRVISVSGYNADGQALVQSLDVKYQDCADAIGQILENETISALLDDDGLLSIAVVGADDAQTSRVLSRIETCTAGEENVCCYSAHAGEVEEAHDMGLSYGKYRMFREIQALDPEITAEEVQGMTMRELQDLWDRLAAGEEPAAQTGTGAAGHHGADSGGHHQENEQKGWHGGDD